MRYQRNTVLAGIAALALLAGGSFASAQDNQNGQSQTGQPQANHQMQMNKQPAVSNKMSQSAQEQKTGQSAQQKKIGQTAQERMNGPATKSKQQAAQTRTRTKSAARAAQLKQRNHHAMARTTRNHRTATAQERSRMTRQNTAARERKGFEGLQGNAQGMQGSNAQGMQGNPQGMQGNASGMNMRLSDQQRDQIRSTVINAPGAPRAQNVQFNVAPGTVIPRGSIHVVPVPRTLVRIEPRWRGFRYFVWMDDVVIVDPHTMRIVAVVPA